MRLGARRSLLAATREQTCIGDLNGFRAAGELVAQIVSGVGGDRASGGWNGASTLSAATPAGHDEARMT